MQTISDTTAGIYEAVATLEHGGRASRRTAVIEATGLSDDAVRTGLEELVRAGMLERVGDGPDPQYEPSRRGWSAVPEQAEGHHLP
jgi:DNA-binding transcriptional regulator PaaX